MQKKDNLRSSCLRSYAQTWKWYVRGNVVSGHAQKIIVQLMATNCCNSKRRDDNADEADETNDRTSSPETDLASENVHGILDRMSAAAVKKPQRRNIAR